MSTPAIRNVVLVGHNGTGKTSLAEAMLYRAGVIGRLGRVDEGSTVCDFDPSERDRHQSLALATASFSWNGTRINLIDTPGYADFAGEVLNGLFAADLAVLVVDAVSGVQARDVVAWREAEKLGRPRMIFVNGLDRENSSFERTLESLREAFGNHVEPVELPIGAERTFSGITDLVTDNALDYTSGEAKPTPVPAELASAARAGHEQLLEDVVEADDELLEQYLEGTEPTADQLAQLIHTAVDQGSVFPVLCGSATTPIGVDQLLDYIVRVGPAPGELGPTEVQQGSSGVELDLDPAGPALAVVFKTKIDDFLGQISYLKVLSGTIRANNTLLNSRTGDKERLHQPITLVGSVHSTVNEVPAGDIAAVTKLGSARTGDTFSVDGASSVLLPPPPTPVYGTAIRALAPAQEDKLATALRRLAAEDPGLTISHEQTTQQTVLSGGGAAHIRIALSRLDRLGISYETEPVRVAYLETLARPVDIASKFKKQSGGHGQFAVAMVRFEPLARGAGYEFDSEVTGGAIPRNYIPAVGVGIAEAMAGGGKYGFPLVDLRAVCYDGKHHSVDSSEMSFKIAGSLALKSAVEQAGSEVLEPVSEVLVEVADRQQGDVLGDLNSRRGHVLGTEPGETAGTSVIRAHVPTSEILSYVIDLRSMTGGTGTFTATHYDYQPLPVAFLSRFDSDGN